MFLVPVRPLDFGRGDAQGRRMAEDDTGEVPKLPPDARLESLDKRLDRLQRGGGETDCETAPDSSYQAGQLVLSNLIGAPAGGIIGFLLDKWLGTQPWLLLIMLFLGFAGGFMNVIRISRTASGSGRSGQD